MSCSHKFNMKCEGGGDMISELFLVSLAFSILKGVTLLVSYINNNAFPQPLNEKEEARYLKVLSASKAEVGSEAYGSVDLSQVEYARNKLVEHNLRLVAHLVKKFDGTGEDSDDMISIGTIGLIKGINTFNPDKGTKLATYAARCIENEILMHLRSLKKSRGEVSIYDPIGIDKEGNEITLTVYMYRAEISTQQGLSAYFCFKGYLVVSSILGCSNNAKSSSL